MGNVVKKSKSKLFITHPQQLLRIYNMNYQFQFEGKTYECIGEDKDWQIEQFRFAIEDRQWVTVKNRIINQLMWGPRLKEIK